MYLGLGGGYVGHGTEVEAYDSQRDKTAATGDLLRPNHTHSVPLGCVRSPINYILKIKFFLAFYTAYPAIAE
jgi:hypothetical protein